MELFNKRRMITSKLMSKLIELSEPMVQENKWILGLPLTEKLGKYLNIEVKYPEPKFYESGGVKVEAIAFHQQTPSNQECFASVEKEYWDNNILKEMKNTARQQALNEAIDHYYPNLLSGIFALFTWTIAYNNKYTH